MFHVKSVIKKQPIINPAVVAKRQEATPMLEVTLQLAKDQSSQPAEEIGLKEVAWLGQEQKRPPTSNQEPLANPCFPMRPPTHALPAMVSEMTLAP
jgi:hypothetical protein